MWYDRRAFQRRAIGALLRRKEEKKMQLVVQMIGIIAMAFNILSYQGKSSRRIMLMQMAGTLLFTVHMGILGAATGAVMNLLGMLRALVYAYKEKTHADSVGWVVGFEAAYIVYYALLFACFGVQPTLGNLLLNLLPVIGMTAMTIAYYVGSARAIRMLGLISSPVWLVYNWINGSVGGVLCECITLASIIGGLLRYRGQRETE